MADTPLLRDGNYRSGKEQRERDNDLMRRNRPSKLRQKGRQSENVRDTRAIIGNPYLTDVSMSINSPERMANRQIEQRHENRYQLSLEGPEADPQDARDRHFNKMTELGKEGRPDRGTSRFSPQNLPQIPSAGAYRSIGSYLQSGDDPMSRSRFPAQMSPPPSKPQRRASTVSVPGPIGLKDVAAKSHAKLDEVGGKAKNSMDLRSGKKKSSTAKPKATKKKKK